MHIYSKQVIVTIEMSGENSFILVLGVDDSPGFHGDLVAVFSSILLDGLGDKSRL